MKTSIVLLLLLCFLPSSARSQAVSTPHRNSDEEDAVAKLFDAARTDAKLHHLSRIRDRKELEQLVCTASFTGEAPRFSNGHPVLSTTLEDSPNALYRSGAGSPSQLTPELQRIALFERPRGRSGHRPGHARYSVAVWPVIGKSEYWVGVELFWSAGTEFFLNHFSDAMEWKNEWKQFVAPQCRDVR